MKRTWEGVVTLDLGFYDSILDLDLSFGFLYFCLCFVSCFPLDIQMEKYLVNLGLANLEFILEH